MTPTKTATARSVKTVTAETKTMTNASDIGTLCNTRKLDHSNVPRTTINMTPTSAATGTISISPEANNTNASKTSAAVTPDVRPRPPEFMLIIDCPIIAQPPMPPKKPQVKFAAPCATHSLFPRPRVSVSSSTSVSVRRDSIKPTAARTTAYGNTIRKVSNVKGTIGIENSGNPPCNVASLSPVIDRRKSTIVGASKPKTITTTVMPMIAASDAGTAFVSFGKKKITAMVAATRTNMVYSCPPCIHCIAPSASAVLNCPSCAIKITMARPLTKPSITGWGTMRINLPRCNTPARTCNTPIRTIAANIYSIPCVATSATSTTAIAPVAPEIIPGLPLNIAVMMPTINAACNPTIGSTPATKAKATASGTRASATVNPERMSARRRILGLLWSLNIDLYVQTCLFYMNHTDMEERTTEQGSRSGVY